MILLCLKINCRIYIILVPKSVQGGNPILEKGTVGGAEGCDPQHSWSTHPSVPPRMGNVSPLCLKINGRIYIILVPQSAQNGHPNKADRPPDVKFPPHHQGDRPLTVKL